jgi:hypothetical protein
MSNCWGDDKTAEMDHNLSTCSSEVPQPEYQASFVQHLPTLPISTLEEEMQALSSIPNYHFWDFVKIAERPGVTLKKPNVAFSQHLLWSPSEEESSCGLTVSKYIPTSPRNRVMFFMGSGHDATLEETIVKLYDIDLGDKPVLPIPSVQRMEDIVDEVVEPVRKKRKHAARLLRMDRVQLSVELGVDLNSVLNSKTPPQKLYLQFCEQLITDGVIQWRHHDEDHDIVVLSDYDSSTGLLLPNSFVHVQRLPSETGELMMKCSCKSYEVVEKAVLHQESLLPGEEAVLAENLTCMHCRFFKDKLVGSFEIIASGGNMPFLHQKIMDSQGDVEEPVYLLGNVVWHGATKFSVRGSDRDALSFAIVHISFRQQKCCIRCLDGWCSAKASNKSKVPRCMQLDESSDKQCCHLKTMAQHWDAVKVHFPEYFEVEEGEDGGGDEDEDEEVQQEGPPQIDNLDDENITKNLNGNFDMETGLWAYPSVSNHIPSELDCPEAIL